jgi:putative endonuclease
LAYTHQQKTGAAGEALARRHLEEQGFEIMHANWRYGHAEVDVIATRAGILHFIEVKTLRGNRFGPPEARVNAAKLNKLKEAASGFLHQQPHWLRIQFDIVAVQALADRKPEILLIEDVF